ncbi:hypothetical protein BH10ACT7_BH10ACT7_22600 [soil metagenome]
MTQTPPTPRPERLWREIVGEELRRIRTERGDTLQTVSKRAGVSPQYISEVERGIKEPSSEMLAAIGGSMDTSLLDLTSSVADRLGQGYRGDVRLAA